ncbi:methyltransferase [Paenibacillus sp. J31TS4]|uniref:class I SAM-dependent methyltransferase n=1 Tax=Paenibacillus sp. J31TS4 TaxID=2807195 RepID=UPI001B03C618|nr:class I SAM-dependent methyltransferase [Paenibacillus sp. J31TS4]GIP40765.1 methyltransferase [Paenibacillus sp. J31TS4]
MASDNKTRFSSRVDHYVKYRPSYPEAAIDYLYGEVGFRSGETVADVGAGTGIFTSLLLERGSVVYAVEPNQDMREAAVAELGASDRFRPIDGSAEETGLPDGSVSGVVCAQAFHWFDREGTKREFQRILKPEGVVALVWNERVTTGTPFLEEYEELLHRYGIDYAKVNHRNVTPDVLRDFFRDGAVTVGEFPNRYQLSYEGLEGRLRSSSYSPQAGHPNHEPMLEALRQLFARHERDGRVPFDYETRIYWGRV